MRVHLDRNDKDVEVSTDENTWRGSDGEFFQLLRDALMAMGYPEQRVADEFRIMADKKTRESKENLK
jgi:hypothetical protein